MGYTPTPETTERGLCQSFVYDEGHGMFLADGKMFPYMVSADHPIEVRQLEAPDATRDERGLHLVKMTILCALPFRVEHTERGGLIVGGQPFPYFVSDEGVQFAASLTVGPRVTLAFYARHVEGLPITEGSDPCSH